MIVVLGTFFVGEIVVGQWYMGVFVCPSGLYNKIDPRAPMAQLILKATCSVREDETTPLLAMVQVPRTRKRYFCRLNVA